MLPLALILHVILGASLTGVAIVVALVLGFDTAQPIVISGFIGFLASVPLSWLVAGRSRGETRPLDRPALRGAHLQTIGRNTPCLTLKLLKRN